MHITTLKVIINGRSGALVGRKGGLLLEAISKAFAEEGIDADLQVRTGRDIGAAIDAAVNGKDEIIVVGGGDGTINAAAVALSRAGKVLGILPMGTLNLYAQDLGIPLDPAQAAHVLAKGVIRRVDYAEVEGRPYLCNCIMGILPPLMRQREHVRGKSLASRFKKLFQTAFTLLKQNPRIQVHLQMNGSAKSMNVLGVAVCNNEYHNAYALFPHPVTLDAAKLSVYVARESTRMETLRLALRLFLGTWESESDLAAYSTDQVSLSSPQKDDHHGNGWGTARFCPATELPDPSSRLEGPDAGEHGRSAVMAGE